MERSSKSHLIISLTGGLGNQLFQVSNIIGSNLEANLLFTKSFGRPRLNDFGEAEISSFKLPFPHEYAENSEAPYFFRKVLGHTLKISEHPKGYENSGLYFSLVKLLASILTTVYYRKITIVRTNRDKALVRGLKFCNYLMVGYFQCMSKESKVLSKEVLSEIEISGKTVRLEREMNYALAHKIIFVHIRLTDYLNEPAIGLLSSNYFNQALQEYLNRVPFKEIWIFSDDHVMARKVLSIPVNVKVRYIPETEFSVAESFELLRCGSYYILSNSTFGWWAAFLCRKTNPLVVMPIPWFRNLNYDSSLNIENWKQVPAEWSE